MTLARRPGTDKRRAKSQLPNFMIFGSCFAPTTTTATIVGLSHSCRLLRLLLKTSVDFAESFQPPPQTRGPLSHSPIIFHLGFWFPVGTKQKLDEDKGASVLSRRETQIQRSVPRNKQNEGVTLLLLAERKYPNGGKGARPLDWLREECHFSSAGYKQFIFKSINDFFRKSKDSTGGRTNRQKNPVLFEPCPWLPVHEYHHGHFSLDC